QVACDGAQIQNSEQASRPGVEPQEASVLGGELDAAAQALERRAGRGPGPDEVAVQLHVPVAYLLAYAPGIERLPEILAFELERNPGDVALPFALPASCGRQRRLRSGEAQALDAPAPRVGPRAQHQLTQAALVVL